MLLGAEQELPAAPTTGRLANPDAGGFAVDCHVRYLSGYEPPQTISCPVAESLDNFIHSASGQTAPRVSALAGGASTPAKTSKRPAADDLRHVMRKPPRDVSSGVRNRSSAEQHCFSSTKLLQQVHRKSLRLPPRPVREGLAAARCPE